MKLFLDDTREFPKEGFQCCRNSKQAIMLLSVMKFDFITLDYSLSDGDKGMAVLEYMKEKGIFVPNINIHSNHTEGRYIMYDYCKENFPDSHITLNMLMK